MSDQESQATDTQWEATTPFSTNGNDHGGTAVATEDVAAAALEDRAKFLADLAHVMQATAIAEQARNAEGTEQRRQARIDAIRAREALEAEELRELAKDDVNGIDAWSEGEIKRIKLERERRIASRREQLQIRLEEHRSVVTREVEAVESAIAAYRADVDLFFARLGSETDPVEIARQAGNQPDFPQLELIGPDDAPVTSDAGPFASEEPTAEAAANDDAEGPRDGDDASGSDGPMVGVMDPDAGNGPAETPWESGVDAVDAVGGSDGSDGSVGSDGSEGSEEPAPVVAEARVVMPRSSGAGSWLRWPNSSPDHSDPNR